jgi:hypothetical protein
MSVFWEVMLCCQWLIYVCFGGTVYLRGNIRENFLSLGKELIRRRTLFINLNFGIWISRDIQPWHVEERMEFPSHVTECVYAMRQTSTGCPLRKLREGVLERRFVAAGCTVGWSVRIKAEVTIRKAFCLWQLQDILRYSQCLLIV